MPSAMVDGDRVRVRRDRVDAGVDAGVDDWRASWPSRPPWR